MHTYLTFFARTRTGSPASAASIPKTPPRLTTLGHWVEDHGFQGVRLSPAEGPAGDWFRGPLMPPIFRRAEELKVPLLMLTRPSRLPDLARLLDRFPDLDVVVDHMADAHPNRPEEIQAVLDLARYPKVYVKISHTWSISDHGYPWTDTHAMSRRSTRPSGAAASCGAPTGPSACRTPRTDRPCRSSATK